MSARIEITVHVEEDGEPLTNTFTDAFGREDGGAMERELSQRLSRGDVWAWAEVEVRATLYGPTGNAHLTASVYLSGCSYKDEADFRADGYFADMAEEARAIVLQDLAELQDIDPSTL